MKNFLFLLFISAIQFPLFSQTYNDGKILRPGKFTAGINPVLEKKLPGVYFRGGYGIVRRMDMNVKYGVFEGADYVGADLEWYLKSNRNMDVSVYAGAHGLKNYGLDGGLAAGFTINTRLTLFAGLDADFNFNINNDRFFWLPLGMKIYLSPRMRFILEGDLPLVEFAPGIFGGGFSFALN